MINGGGGKLAHINWQWVISSVFQDICLWFWTKIADTSARLLVLLLALVRTSKKLFSHCVILYMVKCSMRVTNRVAYLSSSSQWLQMGSIITKNTYHNLLYEMNKWYKNNLVNLLCCWCLIWSMQNDAKS